MSRVAAAAPRVPGDWLWHPLPLAAAALLALNDRVLKAAYGSWWTGKLSDVAGLVFFPLLLVCLWELALWLLGRPWRSGRATLATCTLATLVTFSLINLFPAAGEVYARAVDAVWAVLARVTGGWLRAGPVRHTVDPTDLLALPALWVPWAWGRRRLERKG